jgi:hypothetical protein
VPDHLHDDLADIARHAQQTGRLGPAAAVRGRGDRRRRNHAVGTTALSVVLLAGAASGAWVNTRPDQRSDRQPVTADSAPFNPPDARRQYYLQSGDNLLSAGVDRVGGFPVGGDTGDTELFHFAGPGPYTLQTIRLTGGEPSCVEAKDGTLVPGACDAGAASQDVVIAPAGTDAEGRQVFGLTVGGLAVTMGADGRVGTAATSPTTFFLEDGGVYDNPFD